MHVFMSACAHVCIRHAALGPSLAAAFVYQAACPAWFLEEKPVLFSPCPSPKLLLCLKDEGDALIRHFQARLL